MHAWRIPIVSASLAASSILVLLSVGPIAAANSCTLSAPSTVRVGDPLAIVGSGFPATTDVDVALTVEGGTPDEFTVQSNAAGGFQISLTPEEADAGKTTVKTTAGTACSATVTFTVLGANEAAPTPPATASPRGSSAGASAAPKTAPRTDAAPVPAGSPSGGSAISWLLATLSLAIGLSGLIVTRPSRSR